MLFAFEALLSLCRAFVLLFVLWSTSVTFRWLLLSDGVPFCVWRSAFLAGCPRLLGWTSLTEAWLVGSPIMRSWACAYSKYCAIPIALSYVSFSFWFNFFSLILLEVTPMTTVSLISDFLLIGKLAVICRNSQLSNEVFNGVWSLNNVV